YHALKAVTNYKKSDMNMLLEFLCGTNDITLITKAEAERIIKWVDPQEDENGDYFPKNLKRLEQAKMILEHIQNAGQEKLL
ncbi:hypothetical protein D9V86_07245, partial [Bacteroidetes/Chlorobi group bacterium ChocPot_Mid]